MILKQYLTLLAILSFFLLSSCSNSEEKEDAGVIKKTTDSIAHKAVDRIQSPIDKANAVKDLHVKHENEILEVVEQK